jgi:hypothetical protein
MNNQYQWSFVYENIDSLDVLTKKAIKEKTIGLIENSGKNKGSFDYHFDYVTYGVDYKNDSNDITLMIKSNGTKYKSANVSEVESKNQPKAKFKDDSKAEFKDDSKAEFKDDSKAEFKDDSKMDNQQKNVKKEYLDGDFHFIYEQELSLTKKLVEHIKQKLLIDPLNDQNISKSFIIYKDRAISNYLLNVNFLKKDSKYFVTISAPIHHDLGFECWFDLSYVIIPHEIKIKLIELVIKNCSLDNNTIKKTFPATYSIQLTKTLKLKIEITERTIIFKNALE